MLIQLLRQCFFGDAASSENRSDGISPDVNDNKVNTIVKVIVPDKFKDDVNALEAYIGNPMTSGLCITISLQELLTIVPRKRRRVDAYHSLKNYLENEMGVKLEINSKKSKKDEAGN